MVFESIVADVLNRILGDYIENLDSKQLSIGIWGGDVVLENLVLKQSALEDLDLPIQAVYGRLGKLVLKIPWKNLYGAPVEAAIERLFLLVVPNLDVKYNPEKEEKLEQDAKQAELARIETAKRKAEEQGKPKTDDTFVEKLTTQIIKNVQVKIKDIHIRYEDKVTNSNKPFAFGVTLNNLSVETTNDQWIPAINTDSVSKIFKVLNLDALSVYWNCNCPLYSAMSVNNIIQYFHDGIATRDMKPDNYLYILGPINSSARLRLNPKPENDEEPFSIPKILLNLEMEKLAIGISKSQYQDMILLAESMERMSRGQPYRKFRPFVRGYRGHYRDWWHFAYACVLEDVRRRRRNWDWQHISRHRTVCSAYADAYQTKLKTKNVPPQVQLQIKECEKVLDIVNLVIIRQRIELEVARLEKKTEEQKKKSSWFSGWWGKNASEDDTELSTTVEIMKQFEEAMSPEEKAKLYRAIDYQENSATPTEYPDTFVSTVCGFLLRGLELTVCDDSAKDTRVLSTELRGVNCRLHQRPAANALQVGVKIDQFTVYGLQQGEVLPQIVSSEDFSEGGVLLDVLFETNPLDRTCGQRLHVKSQPLRIVYDAQTIIKIADVFKTPQSVALEQLSAAAGDRLANFREMSATGLQFAVEQHVVMDLQVHLSAPYIVVPYGGLFLNSKSVLVINLGHLKLTSVPREQNSLNVRQMHREGTAEDDILKEMMSQSYDKFICELKDVQILMANEKEDWRSCIRERTVTEMHILQPMDMAVYINKSLVMDDPRLPKMKIAAQLPSVMINLTEDRILRIIALVASIPLPESAPEPGPLQRGLSKSHLSKSNLSLSTDIKSRHKLLSATEPTDEFTQFTDLDVKFEMKELVVTISRKMHIRSPSEAADKVLQFQCLALELELVQQTFNTNVLMRLGGVGLTHFRSRALTTHIIHTPMTDGQDEYLFTVHFKQVNKKSPEFHSKHLSCEQFLQLDFTKLHVQLHQESLQSLLDMANDFQMNIGTETSTKQSAPSVHFDRVASTSDRPRILPSLSIIEEGSAVLKAKASTPSLPTNKQRKRQVVETIAFKLTANMKELNVAIANDEREIAFFAIQGVKTDIVIKSSYTQVMATLTDLTVLDARPDTCYSRILCRTGTEEALTMQIVIHNLDQYSDHTLNDMSVLVSMGCLKITFLNSFVSSILDFLSKFQAAEEVIMEVSAAAAESAKQNMQSAYEKATRVELNVSLKAPVILVPSNMHSLDALMLDLGHITLRNNFINLEPRNEAGNPAVIDNLKMLLDNLKVSRLKLDKHLNIEHECTLLMPVSFTLRIKRNLSSSWYNDIPDLEVAGQLHSIEVNLSEMDYAKIMQVVSENLGEGVSEEPRRRSSERHKSIKMSCKLSHQHNQQQPVDGPQNKVSRVQFSTVVGTDATSNNPPLPPVKKTYTMLRFTFTMESLIVNLYKGGIKSLTDDSFCHTSENGLARFTMLVLSLKGRLLTDNSLMTSIVLVDCLLDDTRVGRQGKLIRLMERKDDAREERERGSMMPDNLTTPLDSTPRSMIDVTFQQKEGDMFVDVRIFGFNMIVSIDYLMKIAAFFTPEPLSPEAAAAAKAAADKKRYSSENKSKMDLRSSSIKPSVAMLHETAAKKSSFTLNLKVEQPDIILVERMDSIDTNALILNMELLVNMRMCGLDQSVRASLSEVQLYTCCYSPARRADTRCPVLRPCQVTLIAVTPEMQGLHAEMVLSDVRLSVSPPIIELLTRVYITMSTSDNAAVEDLQEATEYRDIWDQKDFQDSDYWFLRTELGEDVMESMSDVFCTRSRTQLVSSLKETCCVSVRSIVITVEAGQGNKTLPLLLWETSMEATVHDWSSKMTVDGTLTMQMAYYNSRLAVWEPLIEPVQLDDNIQAPWELKLEMKCNHDLEECAITPLSDSDIIDDISFQTPAVSISVTSTVNLELVVTKTFLEIVSKLNQTFTTAMKEGVLIKPEVNSPYKVVNHSGLKITLMIEEGDFVVFSDCAVIADYREVVLESGAQVPLDLKAESESNTSLRLAKTMSAYSMLHKTEEKELVIYVNDMKCTLRLPVMRADKRYFSLNHRGENNEPWGIISDITVDGAEIMVTLRSMLQIHNHFQRPVDVYYMTDRGNELEWIRKVRPGGSMNLPMHAVYTSTSELFFSVEGHCVTAAPYVWKDLQHNLSMVKVLTCPSGLRHGGHPFVMKVCGDIEQVYYENTSRHTMSSTCYNIHLRPAVTFSNCLPVAVVCIIQGDQREYTVKPGNQLHMPTVNPGHSYIVLRLENYLEKQWSCRRDIPAKPLEFSVWSFDSHDSVAKMTLDLGIHCDNKYGTMVLSLYCPFWMLNKTGLMLSYRNSDEGLNILHHPDDFKGPILFSFSAKNFFGKKKASIRVGNGDWSDKFSLDVAGSSGMVVCKAKHHIYQIGVHNQLTYNGLTKQVTFTPYFVVINNAPFPVECQELERAADPWVVVQPNACTPLWPRSDRDDKLLKLRVTGTTQISAPFLITEPHGTLLKLYNEYGGVDVDVQITEGAVYITFTPYKPGLAPALIINHTSQVISMWEKESINIRRLTPKHRILHAWENPNGPRLLIWESGKKKEIEDDLRKDGLGEFSLVENSSIYWVSFLDGMQRVLLFTEDPAIAQDAQSAGDLETIQQEVTVSIHGVGISLVNNMLRQEIMYIGIASSGIIWEASKLNTDRYKQLSVKECAAIEAAYQSFLQNPAVDSIMVDTKTEIDFSNDMMLRPVKRRLRRTFQDGLWLQMKTSSSQLQLHAKVNRLQIDNQMYDCIFPVVLAPVPPPKSVAADSAHKPFAELSVVQRVIKYSSIQQYKYFKVLIQEFHVKVDLGFLNSILKVLEAEEPSENEIAQLFDKDISLVDEPLLAHVSTQSQQEQKNFYDLLHFSPLKIHVSFSLAKTSGQAGTESKTPAFLNVLLQGLGVTLTDMQDVIFRLGYFEREYSFLTQRQLMSEASSHYTGQAVKQLYVLVLGLDVIGNPYGLVLGLTKGVEDLFYEPFQGAIQGPGEFAEGLVLGVRSLFGHTVGGAAGAVSRITGAMGKGIAALTFDKDYQRKRRDQFNKPPANFQEGIARGGKGLVMGVVDGVTGVFTKPISGAKEQGVEGFFKGLGKGAVGLVTRPTAGVIDFASGSLDAVKRVTEMGDEVNRLRAPRFMRADGLVGPYVRSDAEGHKLLMELEKGKYANTDVYAYHVYIIEDKDVLLLTDKRMAYIVHNDIFGGWQVEWSYTWHEIQTPAKVVDRGVQVITGEQRKKVLGIFGSGENGKIIMIPDRRLRDLVRDKIEALRQNA